MGTDMQVTITAPNGDYYRLDTPQPELVGLWLKSLFDHFAIKDPRYPTRFTIEISPGIGER